MNLTIGNMIKAIFYSKFDVHEGLFSLISTTWPKADPGAGPKVVHQVPTASITVPPGSTAKPLIHFPSISPTIIPRQTFCDLPLTLLHHSHRILSHPICIASPSYPRNEFIFSFSIVIHQRTPFSPYLSVTTKLATLFRHLEETSNFLSQDTSPPNTGKIFALCEILLEDLNNYSEAMIPIDEANTINLKLFPTYPSPPPLAPHQVPLAIVNLEKLKDDNWDLTMLRILPFIDGLNSVRRIASRADADYKLVRKAIAHLVYYGCVMLIDVFSFGACYAPTEEIGGFVVDNEMQEEGRAYILMPEARAAVTNAAAAGIVSESKLTTSGIGSGLSSALSGSGLADGGSSSELAANVHHYLDGSALVDLYLSLRQGQSLRNWCLEHAELLTSGVLDVRRFINFGIVKGFLYRVHKYVIALNHIKGRKGLESSAGNGEAVRGKSRQETDENIELAKYLDGTHCFDEICTEMGWSEKELLTKLKTWNDVQIIHR